MPVKSLSVAATVVLLAACVQSSGTIDTDESAQVYRDDPGLDLRDECGSADTDPDTAISACTALIEASSDQTEIASAHHNRGAAFALAGDRERAINDYTRAIELSDEPRASTYRSRGTAYGQLGQYGRAIQDFDLALALDPNDADTYADRGFAKFFLEEYAQAMTDLNAAIERDPQHFRAFYNRGRVHCVLGDQQRAAADWLRSYELSPQESLESQQRSLDQRGYYSGPVDGVMNVELREAVQIRAQAECFG